jgi:RNA polymerase sigma-70 factor (ECF subfamily)
MRRVRVTPPQADKLSELAQAAHAGRPQAVRAFLTTVAPLILRIVRQILGRDHPDVEDIAQEALVATLDALSRFRGECSTGHFVRRIALLTALNARRRLQLRHQLAPHVPAPNADALPGRAASPADQVEAEQRRSLFTDLLDELPAAQAEAIGLHCVLGYTVAETAAATGAPINTVRGRLVAAKAALRQRLAQDSTLCELIKGAS